MAVVMAQGNLVHRAVNLCQKYCAGVVPELDLANGWALSLPFDVAKLTTETEEKMAVMALHVSTHEERCDNNIQRDRCCTVVQSLWMSDRGGGRGFVVVQEGAEKAMAAVRATNKFLTDAEPWKLKGDENDVLRKKVGL